MPYFLIRHKMDIYDHTILVLIFDNDISRAIEAYNSAIKRERIDSLWKCELSEIEGGVGVVWNIQQVGKLILPEQCLCPISEETRKLQRYKCLCSFCYVAERR